MATGCYWQNQKSQIRNLKSTEMRPDNSCELAGRRLSGQVRVIQGGQSIRLENRHLWPIPYFMVGLLLTGGIKSFGLKIKKACRRRFRKLHHFEVFASKPQFQTPESLVTPKLYSSDSSRQVKNEEIVTAP